MGFPETLYANLPPFFSTKYYFGPGVCFMHIHLRNVSVWDVIQPKISKKSNFRRERLQQEKSSVIRWEVKISVCSTNQC